jgi:hypothetical protein
MVFDIEEYENAKNGYIQPLQDAVDEATKTDPEGAVNAALLELDITEQSKIPRHLVERISVDLSKKSIIVCLGGLWPPKGRSYRFATDGLAYAEKLRYDKSWLASRRKLVGMAEAKSAESSAAALKILGSGIGGIIVGSLGTTYWPVILTWLKELCGIK